MPSKTPAIQTDRAVQLADIDDHGCIVIRPEAQSFLAGISQPCAVLAIIGPQKTGKSFLGSLLFSHQNSSFQVSDKLQPCTKGMWMRYHAPTNLLILDCQALPTNPSTVTPSTRLSTLATSLSTTLLLNTQNCISEPLLQQLSLIAGLCDSQPGERSLVWVVRDFCLRLVDLCGSQITEDAYLESAITRAKGKDKIRGCFSERRCVAMVTPYQQQQQQDQQYQKHHQKQLRSQFLQQLSKLQAKLVALKKPKTVLGNQLNGKDIYQLALRCSNALNKNELIDIPVFYDSGQLQTYKTALKKAHQSLQDAPISTQNAHLKSLLPSLILKPHPKAINYLSDSLLSFYQLMRGKQQQHQLQSFREAAARLQLGLLGTWESEGGLVGAAVGEVERVRREMVGRVEEACWERDSVIAEKQRLLRQCHEMAFEIERVKGQLQDIKDKRMREVQLFQQHIQKLQQKNRTDKQALSMLLQKLTTQQYDYTQKQRKTIQKHNEQKKELQSKIQTLVEQLQKAREQSQNLKGQFERVKVQHLDRGEAAMLTTQQLALALQHSHCQQEQLQTKVKQLKTFRKGFRLARSVICKICSALVSVQQFQGHGCISQQVTINETEKTEKSDKEQREQVKIKKLEETEVKVKILKDKENVKQSVEFGKVQPISISISDVQFKEERGRPFTQYRLKVTQNRTTHYTTKRYKEIIQFHRIIKQLPSIPSSITHHQIVNPSEANCQKSHEQRTIELQRYLIALCGVVCPRFRKLLGQFLGERRGRAQSWEGRSGSGNGHVMEIGEKGGYRTRREEQSTVKPRRLRLA